MAQVRNNLKSLRWTHRDYGGIYSSLESGTSHSLRLARTPAAKPMGNMRLSVPRPEDGHSSVFLSLAAGFRLLWVENGLLLQKANLEVSEFALAWGELFKLDDPRRHLVGLLSENLCLLGAHPMVPIGFLRSFQRLGLSIVQNHQLRLSLAVLEHPSLRPLAVPGRLPVLFPVLQELGQINAVDSQGLICKCIIGVFEVQTPDSTFHMQIGFAVIFGLSLGLFSQDQPLMVQFVFIINLGVQRLDEIVSLAGLHLRLSTVPGFLHIVQTGILSAEVKSGGSQSHSLSGV